MFRRVALTAIAVVLVVYCSPVVSQAVPGTTIGDIAIPTRPDGYVLPSSGNYSAYIDFDVWVDWLCPDSATAWPVLKSVAAYYGANLHFTLHTFALSYYANAWAAAVATHIVYHTTKAANPLDSVYQYADMMFTGGVGAALSNNATQSWSAAQVNSYLDTAVHSAIPAVPAGNVSAILSRGTYTAETKQAWKYACYKQVSGTPTVFINGVYVVSDTSASWTLDNWKSIIDPLIQQDSIGIQG